MCPILAVPLIKATSKFDFPFLVTFLVASIVPCILAILFSTVGMVYKGSSGYGIKGVAKFSLAYVIAQYLVTIVCLSAMRSMSSGSAILHITAYGMTFLNALIFALLIQPFLKFTLRYRAALIVAFVTTASQVFCIVLGVSWFWRFSVMGIVTAMVIVFNLTRHSSKDVITNTA